MKPGKDGFVRLFNGKNLSGWAGDPKYWSVKEGAITGVTDGSLKMNRFLTWKGSTIRNFDLQVKVKVSPGGNSGIQYRGTSRPDLGLDIVTGYQCDVVANTPKYNGMLYEERGRRILSHTGEKVMIDPEGQPWVVGQLPVKEFAPGEWHDYRVLVRGNHHQHWIDGHPTADLIDLDEERPRPRRRPRRASPRRSGDENSIQRFQDQTPARRLAAQNSRRPPDPRRRVRSEAARETCQGLEGTGLWRRAIR